MKNYEIMELIPESSKWKFNIKEKFPKIVYTGEDKERQLKERIWWIKKQIRMNTYFNTPTKPLSNAILPPGLCLFDSVLNDNELEDLYNYFNKLSIVYEDKNIIASNQINTRGLIYYFTGDKGETQYYKKTMEQIKDIDENFYNIMKKYVFNMLKIYNLDKLSSDKMKEKFLDKYCQIVILKYTDNRGIWMHIDNIARYDQGPIITTNVGPDYTYYDLSPSLVHDNPKNKFIRVKISKGMYVVMDGPSRIEWAHGLPSNVPYKKIKYSILLKFNKFDESECKYNKTLDTDICYSKVVC